MFCVRARQGEITINDESSYPGGEGPEPPPVMPLRGEGVGASYAQRHRYDVFGFDFAEEVVLGEGVDGWDSSAEGAE